MLDHGERACRWAVQARRIAIWLDFGSPNEGSGDRFGRLERPFCSSMSIFARSCSKCKKPWQDCSFVDIRACRHGLQIAPGRSWEAMLTRCCLRRGYERSPKGLWRCLGRLLDRAGRSERAPAGLWVVLASLLGRPERPLQMFKTLKTSQDDPKSDVGANLDRCWIARG